MSQKWLKEYNKIYPNLFWLSRYGEVGPVIKEYKTMKGRHVKCLRKLKVKHEEMEVSKRV